MLIRLAVTQMFFNVIYTFSTYFINTYLFRVHSGIKSVGIYNFYLFLFWILFFYLGFRLCQKSTRIGIRLAGGASVLCMALLLMGFGNSIILGILMGAVGGFFWPSYLATYQTLGKQSEGSNTFAKASLLASFATIFIPMFFGNLVQGSGYVTGFIVLLIFSAGMVGTSYYLPDVKTGQWVLSRSSFQHPRLYSGNIMQGYYFSFISIASGLLVYMSGESEASVGNYGTYYGMLTLVVNLFMGYLIPERYKKLQLLISGFIFILAGLIFFTDWQSRIIVFNFMIAAANPLFNNPVVGLNFSYINQTYSNSSEGLFVREFGLSIGRVLFFAMVSLYGLNIHSNMFFMFLMIISLFPLLIFFVSRTMDNPKPLVSPRIANPEREKLTQ